MAADNAKITLLTKDPRAGESIELELSGMPTYAAVKIELAYPSETAVIDHGDAHDGSFRIAFRAIEAGDVLVRLVDDPNPEIHKREAIRTVLATKTITIGK